MASSWPAMTSGNSSWLPFFSFGDDLLGLHRWGRRNLIGRGKTDGGVREVEQKTIVEFYGNTARCRIRYGIHMTFQNSGFCPPIRERKVYSDREGQSCLMSATSPTSWFKKQQGPESLSCTEQQGIARRYAPCSER